MYKKFKINERLIQKAYFLDDTAFNDINEEQHSLQLEDQFPNEFYKVLGKVLTFVEKADE
ncbi:hypothetical protein [Crassaminicella indica]|uniref:Uncharacterized protein n=1 Tax=Crassaminicella indica TaxID=2855394 RepID=A0ABX8R836_9CLOT|nr:hypothetical protein [Crassaminicella indica]QXM05189.1 hypothetical protein KVH43_07225 [Crassaminicella indica]